MKALVKLSPEKGLWMEEVPIPSIGVNDVLIKQINTKQEQIDYLRRSVERKEESLHDRNR